MSRSVKGCVWAGLVVVGAFGVNVSAQIAPPPTPAPAPTPVWTPPPPPPPPPSAEPQVPVPAWDRDAQGKLVTLSEPVWFASIRKNQMVAADQWNKINPYMERRRRSFEKAVADNIDLLREVLGGDLDKVEMGADQSRRGDVAKLLGMLKPLAGSTSAPKEMQDTGVLTRLQTQHNIKIANAYREAKRRELQESEWKLPENATDEQKDRVRRASMRHTILSSFVDEAVHAYEGLLLDAAKDLEKHLGSVELSDEARRGLAPKVAKVKAASGREAVLAAMQELVASLDVEHERELLQAVRATRPPLADDSTHEKP
ncbi:MAG: hypothetical protein HRU70_06555 [Phycisphaeraceae bacterium]|nr:MAG: hypothetical protein HRU70_06555 [Phycisphaeraceae bacterium]